MMTTSSAVAGSLPVGPDTVVPARRGSTTVGSRCARPLRGLARLQLGTRLRLAIAAGCAVLALAQGAAIVVVAIAAILLTELVRRRYWLALTLVQGVLAALTVIVTAGSSTAALPLLLLAAFRAGDRGRSAHVLAVAAATAVALPLAWWPLRAQVPSVAALVADGVQWIGLATALGLLQVWSLRLARQRPLSQEQTAQEAAQLVSRLQHLVRRLPNGLHAPAVAEELLDAVLVHLPAERAAVLVRHDDIASPLAVRGADRVPWRDPVHSPGTPARAWSTRSTIVETRAADEDGRRRASTMLCVPLLDADADLIGLLVLDRLGTAPVHHRTTERIEQEAARLTPQLQAALLFSELQMVASVAERERLAREMHDGIAQDLVALAFSLDMLGRQLRGVSATAEHSVAQVRSELNRIVGDIRFSIADLRSSVRSERGLGAALSSQAQSLASSTGLTMHLSLRESTFRLPAQVETCLLRAAQSFLHDVRVDGTACEVWLSLEVEPPHVALTCRHDGRAVSRLSDDLALQLRRLGVHIEDSVGQLHVYTPGTDEPGAPALETAS